MSTEVLVTVIGSVRRGDVCLDDSVPISTLVSDLSRHYGAPAHSGDVVLVDDTGAVLNSAASLNEAGVTHGSRLQLRPRSPEPPGASESRRSPGWRRADPATVVEPTTPVEAATPDLPRPLPAVASGPGTPREPNPFQITRQVLPPRSGVVSRLRHSTAAAAGRMGRSGPATATVYGATPSPAELTLPDAPGAVARWRRAWEDTDYLHRLDQAIVRPQLTRCATIAVVSPKGGVGKTTTTALLGTLAAHLRRDLVLAVDANPDYGSLGRVLCPAHQFFVDDLSAYFAGAGPVTPSMADLNARLGAGPNGLRVLPAPTDPGRMRRIGYEMYRDVIGRMKDYTGLLLLDCGTGLHEPAARAALEAADQVVAVSDADPATASLVAEAIWGIPLAQPLTLVVNKMPSRGGRLDLNRLAQTLPGVNHVVVIPSDPRAASALGVGAFRWDGVPLGWQRAVRELAAVLIASWADLGLERQPA